MRWPVAESAYRNVAQLVEGFTRCSSHGCYRHCRLLCRLLLDRSTPTTSPRNRCGADRVRIRRRGEALCANSGTPSCPARGSQFRWRGGGSRTIARAGLWRAGSRNRLRRHATKRCRHLLFAWWNIRCSGIHFYRAAEPITRFAQFRGKRLAIGMPGTALQALFLQVLKATGGLDGSTLVDLDRAEAVDALIAGEIDVAVFPSELDGSLLQRALGAPGLRLMNVAQAEAIAKTVPGLKHVVLWRGLISLSRDIPDTDIDLIASRNRLLVRKELHPALQYLLLEAMREVHSAPGPFTRLGEFPAEQPNDLPLSPTAEAFYRSGPTFWQRYTSFWLTSLLNRIVFFVIPAVVVLVPVLGFASRLYRWLYVRRLHRLHRALGNLERELAHGADGSRSVEYQARITEIESAVRSLRLPRRFEVDLQRLRVHLRMVQEDVARLRAVN